MSFFDNLQQASWRGVPFGVKRTSGRFGRRVELHEYPFRDDVYPEDLGRKPRMFAVRGFLLENDLVYKGGSVIQQRKAMIDACEASGSGQLVHPTYGNVSVNLLDFEVSESEEDGQYFEVQFSFVRAGLAKYPSTTQSTKSLVASNGILASIAAAANFAKRAIADVQKGIAVVEVAAATVSGWVRTASILATDATQILNSVVGLPGTFGRYFNNTLSGFVSQLVPVGQPSLSSVDALLAVATVNRAAVTTAGAALVASTSDLANPAGVSTAASNLAAALAATAASPTDGIRLLSLLANFNPDAATPNYSVGAAMADIQDACGDLCRRTAVIALANMATTYQPVSSNDALNVRNQVVSLIDAEVEVAGNQGEDDTFTALRALRTAVIQDLNAKGAGLPSVITVTFAGSLPAPVIAQQLYRDASRADQLVTEANPPHPAFMPTSFQALSA